LPLATPPAARQIERDATLQQSLQQTDVLSVMHQKIDLFKAELAATQELNKQLHEQLLDARKEVGARAPPRQPSAPSRAGHSRGRAGLAAEEAKLRL
jgi:hypothetical protein